MTTTTKPTVASLATQVSELTAAMLAMSQLLANHVIAQAQAPVAQAQAPAAQPPRAVLEGHSNCLGDRTYSRPIVAVFGSDLEAFEFQKAQGLQANGKLLAVAMPVWWTPGARFPLQINPQPTMACNLIAVY